jgi:hypothetical protein
MLVGLLFLCVNDVFPNPLGFTPMQEAFFEFLAIGCQLFYCGTFYTEISCLSEQVERYYLTSMSRKE